MNCESCNGRGASRQLVCGRTGMFNCGSCNGSGRKFESPQAWVERVTSHSSPQAIRYLAAKLLELLEGDSTCNPDYDIRDGLEQEMGI